MKTLFRSCFSYLMCGQIIKGAVPQYNCLALQKKIIIKNYQIFRLNFSWDMSKMHYFSTEFFKIAKRESRQTLKSLEAFRPQLSLTFDFGDLKLHDLAKLCFFKLTMTKSNFKKSVMMSFQWRYYHYVLEKRHQTTHKIFHFCPPPSPIKSFGYTSGINYLHSFWE